MACLIGPAALCGAADRYVSTGGNNANPGTLGQPYRTLNFAIAQAVAGDTIYVRGGVYNTERVSISGKAGTAAQPITLRSYPAETAIVDGTGLTPPNGDGGLLEIVNSSHITVQGLEVRNFSTSSAAKVPIGIFVYGFGTGVRLLGNKVHDIQQTNAGGGDGFGVAIKGTAATPIDQFVFDGNEVYNLKTGSSESVALNGNVTNFTVTNNVVHDCNNIGIDFIGYEGTNSNAALDRARVGLCAGNTVYNIDSLPNPAYGGGRGAPGIYVDGGQSITIERNHTFFCNYGISVGSEHAGRFSDSVIVRSNIIHHCHVGGIVLGGSSAGSNGGATNVTLSNNTLYLNDTDFAGGGCIEIQNNVSTTTIKNNIMVASADGTGWGQFVLKNNTNGSIAAGAINWNLYSGTTSASNLEFIWNGSAKSSFTTWKSSSGQDANSTFTTSSVGFTNAAANDFTLLSTSPARDTGDPTFVPASGELDFGGLDRVYGGRVDIGADEFGFAPASNNADLAALVISAGTLTPAFAAATLSYTAVVPEGTSSFTLTPTAAESHAMLRVNGVVVASGTASGAIPLNVGNNTVNVMVTAQDSVTTKTYTLTITRPPGTMDISVEQPLGTGVIDGTGTTSFGTVAIEESRTLTFTVRSQGTDPLTGLIVTKDGADAAEFTVDTASLPSTLAPNTSGSFTVTFAPASVGAKSAAIHIGSSDPDENPFDIALSGTAIDPRARMITPVDGATLAGPATTFTWTAGTGVTSYALWIGNTPGAYDLYAGNEGTNLSKTLTLPTDGRVVYVKLWSLIGGVYKGVSYTYTTPRPVKARVLTPANGSTLTSTALNLTWDSGALVTQIVLWVGTTVDGYDLHNSVETGSARSVTVPADGARIHVTLWSLINGAYQGNRYVFTAQTPVKAALTSPATGSTLAGGTLPLRWNAGVGVSKYVVWLGSAYGGYDLGAFDAGTTTSLDVTVPQDGGPVYVTLWSLINGGYQGENSFFLTAAPVSGNRPARLTSPPNTSTLPGVSVTFTWDAGVNVTRYALWIGSVADGYDLHHSLDNPGNTRTVALPADGRRVFVTLHSLIGGAWQSNSYWFTAATLPDAGAAQIISPATGSTLADGTLSLTWSPADGATMYHIFAGSSPGAYDLHSAGQGTSLSATLTGLPLDGRPLYVTLYSWLNGAWKPASAWFTAANTATGNKPALITSPANGSTLPGAATTFTWDLGVGATNRALWIGSSPGAYDLWSSAEALSNTSRTVTLPTDGRRIHVTLYSFINGAWQSAAYFHTAANVTVTKAVMISPVSGTTFAGATQTFSWSASNAATAYALWIGRTPGGYDIHAEAGGTALISTVNTLPTDGSPVYVTLWSLINGAWQGNEYLYSAALLP